jgi:hypothetical protein
MDLSRGVVILYGLISGLHWQKCLNVAIAMAEGRKCYQKRLSEDSPAPGGESVQKRKSTPTPLCDNNPSSGDEKQLRLVTAGKENLWFGDCLGEHIFNKFKYIFYRQQKLNIGGKVNM